MPVHKQYPSATNILCTIVTNKCHFVTNKYTVTPKCTITTLDDLMTLMKEEKHLKHM